MGGVEGFGANSNEDRDETVVPATHTAYRRFRFLPRPTQWENRNLDNVSWEWGQYLRDNTPEWRPRMYDIFSGKSSTSFDAWARELLAHNAVWDPCLTGATMMTAKFHAGENTAQCLFKNGQWIEEHTAPHLRCECGFWAYHHPDYTDDIGLGTMLTCLAAVEVWGRTVLGTKGVRAEKMKISGVVVPESLQVGSMYDDRIMLAWKSLVKSLGVPEFQSRGELVRAFPPKDVTHLLPKKEKAAKGIPDGVYTASASSTPVSSASSYYSTSFSYLTSAMASWTPSRVYTQPFWTNCCMCTWTFEGKTQEALDKILATHMIERHMEWKAKT